MSSVSYEKELPLAIKPLYQTLVRVLDQFVVQSQANKVTMCIGAPASGELCVPVALIVTRRSVEDASIGIAIDAHTDKFLFPRFEGAFLALSLSPNKTTLRLTGEYRVPIGAIGSIINAAALHGIAEANLRHLLEDVAEACIATIRAASVRDYSSIRGGL